METSRVIHEPQPSSAGKLLPRCKLCDEVPEDGIAGGYLINRNFLCKTCEDRIMNLTIGSKDYDFFKERLKKLW